MLSLFSGVFFASIVPLNFMPGVIGGWVQAWPYYTVCIKWFVLTSVKSDL